MILWKLDPANNKSVLEIQNDALHAGHDVEGGSKKSKGKRKAQPEVSDPEDDAMDLDADVDISDSDDEDASSRTASRTEHNEAMVPMAESGGIQVLRDKLHARMAQLRRGGRWYPNAEAGSRDELMEERRSQRAAMREKRRKETKEKIKKEEEARGKKGKEKEKGRVQGSVNKVCSSISLLDFYNNSFPIVDTTTCPGRVLKLQSAPSFLCACRSSSHDEQQYCQHVSSA